MDDDRRARVRRGTSRMPAVARSMTMQRARSSGGTTRSATARSGASDSPASAGFSWNDEMPGETFSDQLGAVLRGSPYAYLQREA